MANGFVPYLLMQSKDIFQNATPSEKLTPPGYLKYLLSNNIPNIVSKGKDDGSGHVRSVKFHYATRLPAGRSSEDDDCKPNIMPERNEAEITTSFFRKFGIFFENDRIAQYEKEASQSIALGQPSTTLMREMYDTVIRAANGLFADINMDLLTAQSTNFGINVVTASAAAQSVNFPLSTATNPLTSGMTKVMSDAMMNEMNIQNCAIVGSGLINNYYMQQPAKSADQSGLNTSGLALPKFFFDPYAQTYWGANKYALFEKNAVQLVNVNRFSGFKGGDMGVAQFGTLTLPVIDFLGDGILGKFTFDYQKEFIKCPQDLEVLGYPVTSTESVGRGWLLTLMASYDQFNIQSDAYEVDDRLSGNNGSLYFTAANS